MLKKLKLMVKKKLAKKYIGFSNGVYNIGFNKISNAKKVLVVYIPDIYTKRLDTIKHSNTLEAYSIVDAFINNGYIVDIISCTDSIIEIKSDYDCVFGLGNNYLRACNLNPNALKIIYLTESSPEYSFEKEKERIDRFNKRYNKIIKLERTNKYINNEMINISDYAILIGNEYTKRTYFNYDIFDKIHKIKSSYLRNEQYIKRDCKDTKSFLWLGSNGAVHKGLDYLIESFDELDSDFKLHICGLNDKDYKLLKPLIDNKSNIYNHGFIKVQSDDFLDICSKCTFMILPSCSEGMSTSVLTAMGHGLIPLITRNCGVDLENDELYIDDLYNLSEKITSFAKRDLKWLDKLSIDLELKTKSEYSVNCFANNFEVTLKDILNEKNNSCNDDR